MLTLTEKGKNPLVAITYLFKGLGLSMRKELRKFFLIPILINLVLYSGVLALGYYYVADLIDQLIPGWLSWLEWILWPLFFISFFVVGFFTFTILANLIASPFYSQLAAKTVEVITGQKSTVEAQPFAKVMAGEIKRILYLLTRMIPLLILFIIPGINVVAPVIWALFGAWGLAMEYMAYPLENQGLVFDQQKQLLKTGRFANLGFGGVTVLGLTIPILNLIVAPAAVIGATVYLHDLAEDK